MLMGAAGGGIGGAISGSAAAGTAGAAEGAAAGAGAGASTGALSGAAVDAGIGLKMTTELGSLGAAGVAPAVSAAEAAFAPTLATSSWGGASQGAFFGGAAAANSTGLTSAGMEAEQTAGFNTLDLAGWKGTTAADSPFIGAVKQAGSFLNENKNLINIGTSLYGMTQAQALQQQALLAQQQANQWASSGGQALGVQQLQSLMLDPSQQAASDPAYKLRLQAAQRAMAGYGQGSGMMAVAGANASTDWYNQRMAQLASVAGAPGNAVGAAQVGLTGVQASNQLMNQSMQGVGASLDQWFGGRK